MDRRKRLLNEYEEITHRLMEAATSKHGAVLYAKVRMADALDIDLSGLTEEEYSYALRSHFDFVTARTGDKVAFAVEFDGRKHNTDARVIYRDSLKNAICAKLEMPLLRIDDSFFRAVGRFSLLGWLIELWFLNDDFLAAQERGDVPYDEVFHYGFILAHVENGKLVRFPYDPFIRSHARLQNWGRDGLCLWPGESCHAQDPQGYDVTLRIFPLRQGRSILGVGRCRSFAFPPISPRELSYELAILDAAQKMESYLRGKYDPSAANVVQAWRDRLARWKAYL